MGEEPGTLSVSREELDQLLSLLLDDDGIVAGSDLGLALDVAQALADVAERDAAERLFTAIESNERAEPRHRGWALLGLVRLAGDSQDAALHTLLDHAIEAATEAEDDWLLGALHNQRARLHRAAGALPEAETALEQSILVKRKAGDDIGIANSLSNLAEIARLRDDFENAVRLLEAAVELVRRGDDEEATAECLVELGHSVASLGRVHEAWAHYREALELVTESGNLPASIVVRWSMAELARATQDVREESLQLAQLATTFLQLRRPMPEALLTRLGELEEHPDLQAGDAFGRDDGDRFHPEDEPHEAGPADPGEDDRRQPDASEPDASEPHDPPSDEHAD